MPPRPCCSAGAARALSKRWPRRPIGGVAGR
jgi:hypothetical protein